jgi:hypothetical protein
MSTRFTDVDDGVVDVFLNVMEERFPSLIQLKIKLIFDLKRRVVKGEICLASTELANEKIKFFSKDQVAVEGYDVVIIIDKKAWEVSSPEDRKRVISHELRHIFINEEGKVKLIPHDISDFRIEQKLNQDDPDWKFKLATLVNDIYEQEREMAKQSKQTKKGELNG